MTNADPLHSKHSPLVRALGEPRLRDLPPEGDLRGAADDAVFPEEIP